MKRTRTVYRNSGYKDGKKNLKNSYSRTRNGTRVTTKSTVWKRDKDGTFYQESTEKSSNLLGGLFFLLLVVSLIALFQLGTQKTLLSFLEMLAGVPTISTDWIRSISLTLGDWGAFNFLQVIVKPLLSVFSVVGFAFNGLINLVLFFVYILGWIFL